MTVVVTGGTGGIGREICACFMAGGHTVINLSRRPGTISARHIPTDVTSEQDVKAAFAQIAREYGGIDLLINNAGMGISGAVSHTAVEDAKDQFDVNFFSVLLTVKYALPLMRPGGRILNVSSAAAVFTIPFQAFYSASKSALNTLTLAMRNELKPLGISVCAVMPGDVQTAFTENRRKKEDGGDLYGATGKKSGAVMEADERAGMPSGRVARRICRIACRRGVRPLYTIGLQYKIFAALQKILPTGLVNAVLGRMYIKH